MFRAPFSGIGLLLIASLATSPTKSEELKDLYFGEALYYAHQGYYFEALERLDTEVAQYAGLDEPELDTLFYHIDDAEFSLGDFELRYRMHHRAGRAIKAVLEGAVDEVVRNDAAYRLARIHFQKGQMEDALLALERIDGKIPESIREDIEFLRANVYLAQEKPAESFEVLKRLQGSKSFGGFAAYNLGIAYLQDGQRQQAIEGFLGAAYALHHVAALRAMAELRDLGELTGGPPPFARRDRSRFLQQLDESINAIRRRAAGTRSPSHLLPPPAGSEP